LGTGKRYPPSIYGNILQQPATTEHGSAELEKEGLYEDNFVKIPKGCYHSASSRIKKTMTVPWIFGVKVGDRTIKP